MNQNFLNAMIKQPFQNKLNALCIYHVVDYDGVFSCITVENWVEQQGDKFKKFDYLGWTYGYDLPSINFDNYDVIFLVDLMLPVNLMKFLKDKLVWIDHHLGNIEVSEKEGFNDIQGLRRVGVGACELCWEYFFKDINTPKLIQYVSAYDVFDKNRFDWENETLPIQLGLKTMYGLKLENVVPVYRTSLYDNSILDTILDKGATIVKYENNRHRIAAKNYAFPVEVCGGKYKGICCINTDFGSALFDSISDDYDVCICTNIKTKPDGTVIYPVSMYSDASKTEFNLAKYMQGYRGNGHFHAAGGSLSREEFERLIFERKI